MENLLYEPQRNVNPATAGFGDVISQCKYIVCLTNGLYGLQPIWDGTEFVTFRMHDIGSLVPNLDQDWYVARKYIFRTCGFHVIDDRITMFVVFSEDMGEYQDERYHYLFLNEDSYDKVYGFSEIKEISVD